MINEHSKTINSKSILSTSHLGQTKVIKHSEMIDEHLFVEAIALCALFAESSDDLEEKEEPYAQDEDEPFQKGQENIDDPSEMS